MALVPGISFSVWIWLALWAAIGAAAAALALLASRWRPLKEKLPSWSAKGIVIASFGAAIICWTSLTLASMLVEEPLGPWQEFVPPDRRFRVELPGKPKSRKQAAAGPESDDDRLCRRTWQALRLPGRVCRFPEERGEC